MALMAKLMAMAWMAKLMVTDGDGLDGEIDGLDAKLMAWTRN